MGQINSSNVDKLIEYELGSRSPSSKFATTIMNSVAFFWASFQIVIASPILFLLATSLGISDLLLNDLESRSVHLGMATFLSFLSFPAFSTSPHKKIPFIDWLFSIAAMMSVLYVFFFYEQLSYRIALPNSIDLCVSIVGVVLLLECARRTIGKAVVLLSVIFLLYSYFGQWIPGVISHKGWSLSSIASHLWLSSEGVFGVALGVSSEFVFLYVLFGALLDKAGAGNFFIKLSFSLLGRFTGGPAKAAVLASGLMGMISGSSIANTITIGTFTIPLMKKMGLSPEKAAAIEVSAGVNGQIMPPVMGAAAFLISEFLSIPYIEIIKHALVPAIIIYVTLLYIVHLEACKLEEKTFVTTTKRRSLYFSILIFMISLCCLLIMCGFIYLIIEGIELYGFSFLGIKGIFHSKSIYIVILLLVIVYLLILNIQAKDNSIAEERLTDTMIPNVWITLKSGLHYFVAIGILVWSLVVERVSSSLACFYTISFLMFMLLTHDAINFFFLHRNFSKVGFHLIKGFKKIYEAMISSSKSMLAIAVATGVAGIIVGTVSLTGFGLSVGGLIDLISNGNIFITLVITAIMCIILGMGMPTTACYIIVSTLMVPILDKVIQESGLTLHPLSIHLFVFYFGLMADVTPPVGIASYAAAAIAKGNSFKTSIQAFLYNIRTMIVPFVFVFNNSVILINIKSFWHALTTILSCLVGILSISSAMQGFFIRKSKFYESMLLMLAGLMLVSSQYVYSLFINPYVNIPLSEYNRSLSRSGNVKMVVLLKNSNSSQDKIERITLPIKLLKNKALGDIMTEYFGMRVEGCSDYACSSLDIKYVDKSKQITQKWLDVSYRIVKVMLYINDVSTVYYFFPVLMIVAVIFLQLHNRSPCVRYV